MENKTFLISGASRGIGKYIGLRLAQAGANIVIAAKTTEPHPKLSGTIYTAAKEMEAHGAKVLALKLDVRDEDNMKHVIDMAVAEFGGLDGLINNASAINLSDTSNIPMSRYDLLQDINVRGSFMAAKYSIPHLKKSDNPHIMYLSPPINLDPNWVGKHLAYTMSKYCMSLQVMGLADELKSHNIAVNALWPKTIIGTAAIRNFPGGEQMQRQSRHPQIVADAAFEILSKPSSEFTGNFLVDEDVLRDARVEDFSKYQFEQGQTLIPDFFL